MNNFSIYQQLLQKRKWRGHYELEKRKCRLDTKKKNLSKNKDNNALKRLHKKRLLFSTTGSFSNVYEIFIRKTL